jgi:hypothetical protein
MSKRRVKELYNFVIDPRVLKKLEKIRDRDDISVSEQIRRGVKLWLEQQEREEKQ